MTRRKRVLIAAGAILLVLLVAGVILHWPSRVKIEISPETTYVTGPVMPDGTINYVAALDAMVSEGVTRDNNAAIPLVRALGPGIFSASIRPEVLRRLGLANLQDQGEYYVPVHVWLPNEADPADRQGLSVDELEEQLKTAISAPWSEDDYPILAKWLDRNTPALDLLVAASKRTRYYVPIVSTSDPPRISLIPNTRLVPMRFSARALAARAQRKCRQGQVLSGWSDVLAVHRLARLVTQDPVLGQHLIATSLDATAAKAGAAMATDKGLAPEQAKAMLADLQALPNGRELAYALDVSERFFWLDVVMMMAQGFGIEAIRGNAERGRPLDLDWNLMLRTINGWYDRMGEAACKLTAAERKQANKEIVQGIIAVGSRCRQGRSPRNILLKLAGRAGRKARTQKKTDALVAILVPCVSAVGLVHEARMRTELEMLALALAAFRSETGAWPEGLHELVPKCLPAIPVDRFSNQPLIYKRARKGYLLYSVGRDGRDNGGTSPGNDVEEDDLVVEVKP